MTPPDSILARLMPPSLPAAYLRLPLAERNWRGRWFLMVWVATRHVAYAWWAAMTDDTQVPDEWHSLIAGTTDQALIAAVRDAGAPWLSASGMQCRDTPDYEWLPLDEARPAP